MNDSVPVSEIAIVGVGALFPGSIDGTEFWRNILFGKDLVADVPSSHWLASDYYDPDPAAEDKVYSSRGAFLPTVAFDPMEFGILPNAVPATDSAQLLALRVAKQVLDDAAGGDFQDLDRERISVILGVASATELVCSMTSRMQRPVWTKALRESGLPESEVQAICERIADHYVPWQESSFPGLLGNVVAGRIANRLDLGGTNCVVDAACASSLAALAIGIQELQLGHSDLVIGGGVDALNDILMYSCFSETTALSASGDCRPFSDTADGTILGEGIGMFALRRLADAERDGNQIYAVIKGLGSSSDGRAKSVYAPRPEGQAKALARAYQQAGYSPSTVELVEAHGTGTKAGDAAEIAGLTEVFQPSESQPGESKPDQWCALGSVKSQIGHTKAAAGAAGLLKVVMALQHKVLPPTIKVQRPNPALGIEHSAFYLNTRARPWIANGSHPRRGSVSSFGFGGTNYHITLEEYTGNGKRAPRLACFPWQLVLLNSDSAAALAAECRAIATQNDGRGGLASLARQSQLDYRRDAATRLAVVAEDAADLEVKLNQAADRIDRNPERDWSLPSGVEYACTPPATDKLAYLFPGQGSQYVNMGIDLTLHFDAARAVWDNEPDRLHEVIYPRPVFTDEDERTQELRLTAMVNAQPAIAAASLAQLALLDSVGIKPDYVAGHSFGEITALHAAGCLDAETMLRVARHRGELMTAAAAERSGSMLAVSLTREAMDTELEALGPALTIANHNAPRQVVLSGETQAIVEAERVLTGRGIACQQLPVASAFHSPMVGDSSKPFLDFLNGITVTPPAILVYANTTAAPYPSEPRAIRRQLAEQLARPVRFLDQIEAMYAHGARCFVEVGPGNRLTGLVSQCLADRPHTALALDRKSQNGTFGLWHALGQLAIRGVALDFAPLWEGVEREPGYRPAPPHALMINGANYGKPYPPANGAAGLPEPNAEAPPVAPPVAPPEPVASIETAAPPPAGNALDALHARVADTQREFQASMAASHQRYLDMIGQVLGGVPAGESAEILQAPAAPVQVLAEVPAPAQEPMLEAEPPLLMDNPDPAIASVLPTGRDFSTVLLEVVAERTGYPVEMLELGMELEATLGIDSIKRVEIFAALQERLPQLPEVDTATLAGVQTLQQIVEHMSAAGVPEAPLGSLAPAESAPDAAATTGGIDHVAVLLDVVAERTGYPAEMLALDMELEATLGIDSIKRVEIFSALQERLPELPEVDSAALAEMATLGQVVDYMHGPSHSGGHAQAPQPNKPGEPESAVPTAPVMTDLERQVVARVPTPAEKNGNAILRESGLVAITPVDNGVAEALARRFKSDGHEVTITHDVPAHADALICLEGLGAQAGPRHALKAHSNVFEATQRVSAKFANGGGVFVTVHDSGGDFGLSGDGYRAWLAGMPGLAKTAQLEWPNSTVKAIDLETNNRDPSVLAEAIYTEIQTGGNAVEVGLRANGERLTLTCEPRPLPPRVNGANLSKINSNSVIVVSGGARGVTPSVLEALVRDRYPRLLLLGRTKLVDEPDCCRDAHDEAAVKRALLDRAKAEGREPTLADIGRETARILAVREIEASLKRLLNAGAEVRYAAVDVCDTAAVSAALDDIRREWGAITGLIHAAGTLADKRIGDKSAAQFERVFRTKVDGLHALLTATAGDPLGLIVLFSSVAGRYGNVGQCDYAAANEVLNRVALAEARRRGEKCIVKSLNWGPWDGGMVTPALRAHFVDRGVPLIPPPAGASHLVRELEAGNGKAVEVVVQASGLPAFSPAIHSSKV